MPYLPANLCCPDHHTSLTPRPDGAALQCEHGCSFPVVNGVARFVPSESYASAFGLQWNLFRKTQLDSHTGTTISRDRMTRCVGGDLERLRGKDVLEAGCGAGRFSEILKQAGARLFSCDLSSAVDANMANHREQGGEQPFFLCQADIRNVPAAKRSFDFVVCLGVIQHTPDPALTIQALAEYVKPGGELVIDHYSPVYDYPFPRKVVRTALLTLAPNRASQLALALSRGLCAFHRLFWRQGYVWSRIRQGLRHVSPLVDYYDSYSQLPKTILTDWCVLDTHDTVTDVFKHLRSVAEVSAFVRAAGLEVLSAEPGGNGVELRARRPLA